MGNAGLTDSLSSLEGQVEVVLKGIAIAMDFEIGKKS
jgi:hypothetical protein